MDLILMARLWQLKWRHLELGEFAKASHLGALWREPICDHDSPVNLSVLSQPKLIFQGLGREPQGKSSWKKKGT